jgi:hypothetical protein
MGKKNISIHLPGGQRRLVPRSATDIYGEKHKQIKNLPKISIRTILPVAQLVKAKLAIEEEQHEGSSVSDGKRDKGRKATRSLQSNAGVVEATDRPTEKTTGEVLGTASETGTDVPGTGGGTGC